MTEAQAPKKARTKVEGPRNFVATVDGKEWIIKLDDVRVANSADMNRALDGVLPRAKLGAGS